MAARTPASSLLKSLKTSGTTIQRRSAHSSKGYIVPQGQQAHPLCGFYESHLAYKATFARKDTFAPVASAAQPISKKAEPPKPTTSKEAREAKTTTPTPPRTRKATMKVDAKAETVRDPSSPCSSHEARNTSHTPNLPPPPSPEGGRPSIIFGSRLNASDPKARKERLDALRHSATRVLGVLVPPKPEEPDNCCMSGCVNCVWDTFREEMELWADAGKEVERRRRAKQSAEPKPVQMHGGQDSWKERAGDTSRLSQLQNQGGGKGTTMDDDGGGSESNWDQMGNPTSKNLWDDELYRNVPVGIREFMKLEKKLKEPARVERVII